MMICDGCGEQFEELNHIEGYDFCDDCYNEHVHYCDDCGKMICDLDSNCNYLANYDQYLCDDCCETCTDCSCLCPSTNGIFTPTSGFVCESCANNYFCCDGCEEYYYNDDMYSFGDRCYCESCFHDHMDYLGIHSYGYKPEPYFWENVDECHSRSNVLHVGIELEIQGDYLPDFTQDIDSIYHSGKFYLKLDGSLDEGRGIEIVSQPMTYQYIVNGVNKDWKTIFDKMSEHYMNDTDNCGLHFHLDRTYFTPCNISVIDYIVNNFIDYFSKIGGRDYHKDYYCGAVHKDLPKYGFEESIYNRHVAVNLTNSNTIELRFCKSTADYNEFIKRVKMIACIAEFAKRYSLTETSEMTEDEFISKFEKIKTDLFE